MDIFESLENLNVSEECFDEIMGLVEELLSEGHEAALMKKYGVDSIQKLPKEVRRRYFPRTRHSVENWTGSPEMYVRVKDKSRSHHELSQYKPQEVSHDNSEKKYLPKSIKKVLKNTYNNDIDDAVEFQGHRITKNQAGHYLTDKKRGDDAIAKGKGWRASRQGVEKTNADSYHNYKSYVTPEQEFAEDGMAAAKNRDATLKKLKRDRL